MVDGVATGDSGFFSDSPEKTRDIARHLGLCCRGGEVLFLVGDLGSGKTCFVQGLAMGLDIPAHTKVTSPTFTLHAEYRGRLYLNHLDLYRLEEAAAMAGLGLEDMLADSQAVTAVEWPELLTPLAGGRLEIRLSDIGDGKRRIDAIPHGDKATRLLAAWRAGLDPKPSTR